MVFESFFKKLAGLNFSRTGFSDRDWTGVLLRCQTCPFPWWQKTNKLIKIRSEKCSLLLDFVRNLDVLNIIQRLNSQTKSKVPPVKSESEIFPSGRALTAKNKKFRQIPLWHSNALNEGAKRRASEKSVRWKYFSVTYFWKNVLYVRNWTLWSKLTVIDVCISKNLHTICCFYWFAMYL